MRQTGVATRAAAGDFPSESMTKCWNAPYPPGTNRVILDHWLWCTTARAYLYFFEKCQGPPPGNGCVEVGSINFRVAVMGHGHQDKDSPAARKVKYWMMLDDPQAFGKVDYTATLSFTGTCKSYTAGAPCQAAPGNGRTDTVEGWIAAGYADWEYSSPEGSNTSPDKIAFFDFDLLGTMSSPKIWPSSAPVIAPGQAGFRCDSARYQKWPVGVQSYGCVFDGVRSIWTFKATADVAQTAKHVWTAQFKPNLTRPPSVKDKEIPGSIQSGTPLSRLAGAAGTPEANSHKANRDKSIATCKTNFGAQYSRNQTRDCDEYPMASTNQGAWTGSNDPAVETHHYSVRPLKSEDNQAAGRLLEEFYRTERVINTDEFFVDVVAADGGPYPGLQEPEGISSPIANRQCDLRQPVVSNVQKTAPPEQTFNDYARTTPNGWTGGDSTFSVKLPDGRLLFLFSDTFLGPLKSDGTRPTNAPFVNSTFVLKDGDNLTTLRGGTAATPKGLMTPAAEKHWYWLGDGLIHNEGGTNYLQVLFQEYYKFGPGDWDFRHKANFVAWFSLANLGTTHGHEPLYVDPVPSTPGVGWGSALLPASRSGDGYTYIYGVDDAPINKQMRVARVRGTDLTGDWEYLRPGTGWMKHEKEAANVFTGIANEYSVTPWYGGFTVLSQTSTAAFSGEIRASVSCSPHGPWQLETLVYHMPEPGPYGSYQDGTIFAYNAHIHDTLSPEDGPFTLSYNVNSFDSQVSDTAHHYRDPSIYRPRFVKFSMTPTGGTR